MSAGDGAGDSMSEAAVSNGEAADSNGIVIAGTETRYRGGWKRIDWLIPGVARLISVAWLISIQVFTDRLDCKMKG